MSRHETLIAGAICFISFLLFYGITARGKLQASDEAAVFASGISLATRGHLAIDQLEWLQEHMNVGSTGPDGHLYTKYFPGNVFAVATVYKLTARSNDAPYVWVKEIAPSVTGARWALRLNALWGAIGMTALLLLVRRYFDWRTAITTVALLGFCSDWWYQSRGLFSEVGAGAFLIASLCLMAYERPYASSVALALSILFRPTTLLALPISIRSVGRNIPRAIGAALIIGAAVAMLAAYNWIRFGSMTNFGYGSEKFSTSPIQGLSGVFFSPGRSIFVYSPILLLAIPGAWFLFKKEKTTAVLALYLVLSHAVAIASWHSWEGGVSWGSRLMTPIVPVLGFLAAAAIERTFQKSWMLIAPATLGVIGLAIQILALLRDPTHVLIDRVQSGDVKFEETIYSVRHCWLALQIDDARNAKPCELDSYTLRQLLTNCPE